MPESIAEQGDRVESIRAAIERYLAAHQVPALVKVAPDANVSDGLISLVKSYGFGPLIPNTVLLGKAVTPDDPLKHAELLTVIQQRRRNLVVLHEAEDLPDVEQASRIDIWWRGHRGNIGLMLALTFLLKKDDVWARADVRVWRIVDAEGDVEAAATQLDEMLREARFPARVQVVCEAKDPFTAIRRDSREADLLFLGIRPREEGEELADYAAYYEKLARQTDGLPPTALVIAGEEVDVHRLFASV